MLTIKFEGAIGTVTGSRFLLKAEKEKVLIDCGLYQGLDVEEHNYDSFGFDPKELNCVILTHAHLDHCGLIPRLYKEGFRGKVYMTPPTGEIAREMLLDSAKVQDFRYKDGKKHIKGWSLSEENLGNSGASTLHEPIYSTRDVLDLLRNFKTIDYGKYTKITDDITFKFLRVGHALGAASVWIKTSDKTIVFSGDLGNSSQHLDSRFDQPDDADFVVMESLYGGVEHKGREKEERRLAEIIRKTIERGGNVVIPSFTLQRTQELLYTLKNFFERKQIPDVPVYLDSPLAIKITDIYKKYYKNLNPEIVKKYGSGGQIFTHPNFISIKDNRMSKKIRKKRGSIIIAGHGMCAGGRIIYHLLSNLPDKRSSVVFVGFQAEGTLGREIVDGKKEVFIEDIRTKVDAEIVRFQSFSAHAGNSDLLKWVENFDKRKLDKIFLIHAEDERRKAFKEILGSNGFRDVVLPKLDEEFTLQ